MSTPAPIEAAFDHCAEVFAKHAGKQVVLVRKHFIFSENTTPFYLVSLAPTVQNMLQKGASLCIKTVKETPVSIEMVSTLLSCVGQLVVVTLQYDFRTGRCSKTCVFRLSSVDEIAFRVYTLKLDDAACFTVGSSKASYYIDDGNDSGDDWVVSGSGDILESEEILLTDLVPSGFRTPTVSSINAKVEALWELVRTALLVPEGTVAVTGALAREAKEGFKRRRVEEEGL